MSAALSYGLAMGHTIATIGPHTAPRETASVIVTVIAG
jgi:hypothetical protein